MHAHGNHVARMIQETIGLTIILISEPIVNKVISEDCNNIGNDMIVNIESMDLMVDEVMEEFLDEASWEKRSSEITEAAAGGRIGAAYMVHPGTTLNSTCRPHAEPYGCRSASHDVKKQVRVDTCIALMFLQLVCIFTYFCVPWLMVVP